MIAQKHFVVVSETCRETQHVITEPDWSVYAHIVIGFKSDASLSSLRARTVASAGGKGKEICHINQHLTLRNGSKTIFSTLASTTQIKQAAYADQTHKKYPTMTSQWQNNRSTARFATLFSRFLTFFFRVINYWPVIISSENGSLMPFYESTFWSCFWCVGGSDHENEFYLVELINTETLLLPRASRHSMVNEAQKKTTSV